jgi:hypothetical protein
MNTNPATAYVTQLENRVAELLPGLDTKERLGLLGAMDPGDMRAALAFIAALYPQAFDFAIVRDRETATRLLDTYLDGIPRRGRDVPEAADIAWDRTHPDPCRSRDGGEPPAGGAR